MRDLLKRAAMCEVLFHPWMGLLLTFAKSAVAGIEDYKVSLTWCRQVSGNP